MKKILVCDDEISILNMIKIFLTKEGYEVITANCGREALSLISSKSPDLIVLDVMLPDINGFDILKTISTKYKIPVIMLTAKSDTVDKILGLEFGADDYVTKPFDMRELSARIKALLRRMEDVQNYSSNIFSYNGLEIDFNEKTVKKGNQIINLTPKEFELLKIFTLSKGGVLTREELLNKVWGYDFYGDTRTVDIQIARLRKKIEDDPSNPKYIITVFGFGYKFGK